LSRKIMEVCNEDGNRAKMAEFLVSCTEPTRLSFTAMGTRHSEAVPVGDCNPPDDKNPKLGNPNPEKYWVLEIHFIRPA